MAIRQGKLHVACIIFLLGSIVQDGKKDELNEIPVMKRVNRTFCRSTEEQLLSGIKKGFTEEVIFGLYLNGK